MILSAQRLSALTTFWLMIASLLSSQNCFLLRPRTPPLPHSRPLRAWTTEEYEWTEDMAVSMDDTSSNAAVEHWQKAVNRSLETVQKKANALQRELDKAKSVEATVARAQLITNNLYLFNSQQKTYQVPDWDEDGEEVELTLNPAYDSASDEANALFAQARKVKRGSAVVQNLLQETTEAVEILRDASLDLQAIEDSTDDRFFLIQDRLLRTSSVTNFAAPADYESESDNRRSSGGITATSRKKPALGTPASNVRKLKSPYSDCTILVGRNRRGNEYLSFQVARGQDVWLHARGCPGAHVLLRQRPPQTASSDCWQLAANLAAFYSDARSEAKVEIMAAEPKHILKPARAPLGTVKIRQEMCAVMGFPDNVPDEYKEAREASGQANNYRRTDKAKLKKQNKSNIAKEKEKRRKRQREANNQ